LVGKCEGNGPLGQSMQGIEKIESNLNETWLKAMECIDPVQSRDWWYTLVKTIMNLQFQ